MDGKRFFALGLVMMLALGACSKSSTPAASVAPDTSSGAAPSDAATTAATEKDFEISLSPDTAAAGSTSFDITNNGPSTHEFVVFKTDLAPDALPVKDGIVDEEGKGLASQGKVEDIVPGETKDLSLDLDAGSYVVICNLPGHYEAGMHAGFTVS